MSDYEYDSFDDDSFNIDSDNDIEFEKKSAFEEQMISLSDRKRGYCIIKLSNVQLLIDELVNNIMEILNLTYEQVIMLLRLYRWNSTLLSEKYYENPLQMIENIFGKQKQIITKNMTIHTKDNQRRLQSRLLSDNNNEKKKIIKEPGNESNIVVTCTICYDELCINETYSLNCNHYSCYDCWSEYIEYSILNEGISNNMIIKCPADQCQHIVLDQQVLHLLKNNPKKSHLYHKYNEFKLKSYVLANNTVIKWCPSATCNNLIYQINTNKIISNTRYIMSS